MKRMSILLVVGLISSCVSVNDRILGSNDQSALAKRSIQSRMFATNSDKVLRNVVSTLQDQDYLIDRADKELSVVTATKSSGISKTRITVSVREKDKNLTIVRANAVSNFSQIEDPKFYQVFFNALSQSLFLEAQSID